MARESCVLMATTWPEPHAYYLTRSALSAHIEKGTVSASHLRELRSLRVMFHLEKAVN